METEFTTGLQVLREHEATPKLTTGLLELDSLLAGGVELGTFTLLYGDDEPIIDRLLYNFLCNCQLPQEKYGFDGKAALLNCGNYRQEQVLLDLKLATALLRGNGIDPAAGLDQIIAVSAFNTDQAVESVEETANIVKTNGQVRLVVARNLPKLFLGNGARDEIALEMIQQLQHLLAKLWQTCAERNVALVASCRPRRANSFRPSPPEGGVFLRHLAQVMVCVKKQERGRIVAHLLKHPRRQARMVELFLNQGDFGMGRLTIPFRSQLQQEVENLSRSFKEALIEPARRDAFDSLTRAWTAEQGAMSYAKVPSVLEVMLLAAAVDNRRAIEDLEDENRELRSRLDKLQSDLAEARFAFKTLAGTGQ
jgi:RecA/RadA recombinase